MKIGEHSKYRNKERNKVLQYSFKLFIDDFFLLLLAL